MPIMFTPITDEQLIEIMAETGESEEIVREMWDACQCCGDERG